jgi:small subunit ribosomal protein S9
MAAASATAKKGKEYTWATGRRKTAIARVRLSPGNGQMTVNGRDWQEYFPTANTRRSARQPLKLLQADEKFDVHATVEGGGPQGQADAVRLGLARALASHDEAFEAGLRDSGLMTRDSRQKERKKYGQRGARARFQFSKR